MLRKSICREGVGVGGLAIHIHTVMNLPYIGTSDKIHLVYFGHDDEHDEGRN